MINKIKNYLRYKKEKNFISKSDLFNEKYYLITYPDVRHADVDALAHFIKYGANEGRNPNPTFDTMRYLAENPDVVEAGMNPLYHYMMYA